MARTPLLALVVLALACGMACGDKDAKALAGVRAELALLHSPPGLTASTDDVSLGEMDAFGGRTYCASDDKAVQLALSSMLSDAGWQPVSTTATAEGTVWRFSKGTMQGLLTLETQPQACGRRFKLALVRPL